jgi:hypothetical protein
MHRWTTEASRYKEENDTAYTTFHMFVTFIRKMAIRKNDPYFAFEDLNNPKHSKKPSQQLKQPVFVKKS